MIDPRTVQRILDAVDIYEVVSDFVNLKKRGVNFIGLCPFHSDKTPSFYVSPAKGICKCFSCGSGGNAVHFIMQHDGISYTEALKYLAKKYNIEVIERELSKEEQQAQSDRESMFVLNGYARDYFQTTLHEHVEGRSVGMAYFRQRGYREDIIDKFQLGYCLEHRFAFAQEAQQKGYKKEFLVKTGLCYENDEHKLRDRYWGRIIFPIHGVSGKVLGFGGRVLSSQTKGITAKYVNSPESEIYHKSNILYGIFFAKSAITKANNCILVEGYTDVISMHQSGIENVVASSGTALTTSQIKLIHRYTDNITVLFDGDAAGIKASLRSVNMLLEEGMNVKICLLPEEDDPDSFARKNSSSQLEAYLKNNEVDFIRFKTNYLLKEAGQDPIKRAELIRDIVGSIAVIPEAIIRDVYMKECSQLLKVDDRLLVSEVAKQRMTNAELKMKPVQANAAKKDDTATTDVPIDQTASSNLAAYPIDNNVEKFYKYEHQIIQIIVRHGDKTVYATEENGVIEEIKVIEYIACDMHQDELVFQNPTFKIIFEEALKHAHDEGFIAERFFINYPDPAISRIATELASERYQLSKFHSKTQTIVKDEDRLFELVPTLMINYKYAIISTEIKDIIDKLKDPSITNDDEKCNKLLERYKELKEIEILMAKRLGDRVVLR